MSISPVPALSRFTAVELPSAMTDVTFRSTGKLGGPSVWPAAVFTVKVRVPPPNGRFRFRVAAAISAVMKSAAASRKLVAVTSPLSVSVPVPSMSPPVRVSGPTVWLALRSSSPSALIVTGTDVAILLLLLTCTMSLSTVIGLGELSPMTRAPGTAITLAFLFSSRRPSLTEVRPP